MSKKHFKTPPSTTNPSGRERSVGFEFEFTGLEMEDAAEMLTDLYGGSVKKVSTYEFKVKDTAFGTFSLELDARLLRDKKYETFLGTLGIDIKTFKNISTIEDRLKKMASSVVPFEIITPPIRISEMQELNRLLDELRRWKAKGTGSSFFYAFGLHINPEIPDESAESLLSHLRAYVLLDPWIRKDANVDISRRLTPYINEYREDYLKQILNVAYRPDLKSLIRDYFWYDNSRNRPLDMLPLFIHLEPEFAREFIDEKITKSRPTYHYRLPNCSIEDPEWTLADEWNRWVLVEQLASDRKSLEQYCRAWFKIKKDTMIGFEQKWIAFMNRWVHHNE